MSEAVQWVEGIKRWKAKDVSGKIKTDTEGEVRGIRALSLGLEVGTVSEQRV